MPRTIQPDGWPRPRGYSNGMAASGEVLAVAGQIGWDARERLVGPGFCEQFEQALCNVRSVVEAAGGRVEHVVSMTIFVTDRSDYLGNLDRVGAIYRGVMGRHFPAMALVEVRALLEPGAVVEIQALAVLPVTGKPRGAKETDPP